MSFLTLLLTQTALSSSQDFEPTFHGAGPSIACFLDDSHHGLLARTLYRQGQYSEALMEWQECITLGHNFLEDDDEVIEEYTNCLKALKLYDHALAAWKTYFEMRQNQVSLDYILECALCASSAQKFEEALQYNGMYLAKGGAPSVNFHFVAAQAHTLLNHNQEALYHLREYFALEKFEDIPLGCLQNAAQEFFLAEKYKQASKYMDLYIKKAPIKESDNAAYTHFLAAKIYLSNQESAKSVEHWRAFFVHPEAKPDVSHYTSAAIAFDANGNLEEAQDYFQRYYNEAPQESRILACVFGLGRIYASLGNADHAAKYFNEVLEAPRIQQQEIAGMLSSWFYSAALTYVVLNQPEKVVQVIALHDRLKPHAPSLLDYSVTAPTVRGKNTSKKMRLNSEQTAQHIKRHLALKENERCDVMGKRLAKLSFPDVPHLQDAKDVRTRLLQDLAGLKRRLDALRAPSLPAGHSPSSDRSRQQENLLSLRRDLDLLENSLTQLDARAREAQKELRKTKVLAYLQNLSTQEKDTIPLAVSTNLRGQYGHAKPAPLVVSQAVPACSSSHDPQPSQVAHPTPEVTFSMLRHVPGQLDKLNQMPGQSAKYRAYLDEIAADPTGHYLHKSAHFEALSGEKGLFSMRFDKGNRLVYRAVPTGENAYHVIIINTFGHYKNLHAQIAQSNAMTSHMQGAPNKQMPKKKTQYQKARKRR
ncbi:MAG: hypothetical protein C0514_07985 [Candidatus Puniceispirillum sp.]|nr:hypothetical protein [Candidatus Puniceispirillum sp.]